METTVSKIATEKPKSDRYGQPSKKKELPLTNN
jgi:hypothetical protein